MAQQIFKGFKQVVSGFTGFESGVLYFVRTSETYEDGYLYFNGKKYGTAIDADSELKELLGELPSGETSFASWIEKEIAARESGDETLESAITIESAARVAGDNALLGDATGTTTSAATIYDVKRLAESINLSAHTHDNKAVLDGISAEDVAAWDAAEQNAKDYADEAISSAISILDAAAVVVDADETVASVSEADGVISVTKQSIAISHDQVTDWDTELAKKQDALEFMTEPSSSNKVATAADIADIAGAMHFVGISSTDPTGPTGPTISGHTGDFVAGDVCLWGVKEFIYTGDGVEQGWKEIGDEGLYVTKSTTIAGVEIQSGISKADLLEALNVEDGAQVNIIESVKVNGTALTVSSKTVDVTVTSGSSNGTIAVNGADVEVTGFVSEIARLDDKIDDVESAATEYVDEKIAALDAVVTGESSGTTVVVTEADGVITNVAVENHISSSANNAIEMKADGFFAAIYYEDDDPIS